MPDDHRTLTHIDPAGRARMVDVGDKPITRRTATAEAYFVAAPHVIAAVATDAVPKGSVLGVARLAGIAAAKRTDELIPLCHSVPLDDADVALEIQPDRVRIIARVSCHGRTGIEMEALVAASIAGLTLIDMTKAIDRGGRIEGLRVIEKTGGRSGTYTARA